MRSSGDVAADVGCHRVTQRKRKVTEISKNKNDNNNNNNDDNNDNNNDNNNNDNNNVNNDNDNNDDIKLTACSKSRLGMRDMAL